MNGKIVYGRKIFVEEIKGANLITPRLYISRLNGKIAEKDIL